MQKHGRAQRWKMAVAVLLGSVCLAPPVQQLAKFPEEISVPVGESAVVPIGLALHTKAQSSDAKVVHVGTRTEAPRDITVFSQSTGDATVSTKLFGFIPWKSVRVHVVPQEMVYPGGQSIGVRLYSNGIMVIGFQRVADGKSSPALQAHVQLGDVIEKVNGQSVHRTADLRRCVSGADTDVELLIRRGTEHVRLKVHPSSDGTGQRHLGLYVRDKTAGVGTLTFYEPQQHRFGALGHMITDVDTGKKIEGSGSLYMADVTGIVRGEAGQPGEKRGRFVPGHAEIGHIEENTPFGVFGSMAAVPEDGLNNKEVPVALPSQVHEGPAKLLTVLHGRRVEAFDVEIENLVKQDDPDTKSMIVHILDKRLLNTTGGIVQGMSGSPLLQDGRLVGAVTHVFVSDPTRGYGVYAEWMLHEAEHPETSTMSMAPRPDDLV